METLTINSILNRVVGTLQLLVTPNKEYNIIENTIAWKPGPGISLALRISERQTRFGSATEESGYVYCTDYVLETRASVLMHRWASLRVYARHPAAHYPNPENISKYSIATYSYQALENIKIDQVISMIEDAEIFVLNL